MAASILSNPRGGSSAIAATNASSMNETADDRMFRLRFDA
jgi:hypothetical protein